MARLLSVLGVLCLLCGKSPAAAPHVVFVTGDNEYHSEISMPMIAKILSDRHGMKTTVLYSENEQGQRDRDGNFIPGLEALRTADAAVFFMRFRALPQEQLNEILAYAAGGKPMVGLRTSTHAFKYPGPPNDRFNDGFGREIWGQKWIEHYGHENSSLAHVAAQEKDNPILRGVAPEFWLHSWLYVMNKGEDRLPKDCRIVLEGDAIRGMEPGGETYGERQAVAWTRELTEGPAKGQRIFYTSLGHPRDFEDESPRRLLVNAIYWALGREGEIPAGGPDVTTVGEYAPPDPH